MASEKNIYVFIEVPKGSQNKYELDKERGMIKLDRVLSESMFYPCDYGFIPNALSRDHDELDAFVLVSNPTFPGCFIEARPIGVLKMKDEKGIDDKVLCVASRDQNYKGINDIEQLPKSLLAEIKHFLEQYKVLEKGKFTKVGKWYGKKEALETIKLAIKISKN